jgi:hypothetical protein
MSTTTTAMRRLRATRIEVTPTGLGIQQFSNAQIEQATVDSVARAALDGGINLGCGRASAVAGDCSRHRQHVTPITWIAGNRTTNAQTCALTLDQSYVLHRLDSESRGFLSPSGSRDLAISPHLIPHPSTGLAC